MIPLEIEYKFLLTHLPIHLKDHTPSLINQHYTPECRIREEYTDPARTPTWTKTVKKLTEDPMVYQEDEEEITSERFDELLLDKTCSVYKMRYKVDGWEIDYFPLLGLVIAELEVVHSEHPAIIPRWLTTHVVCDVTDNPHYRNSEIAKWGKDLSVTTYEPINETLDIYKFPV